MTTDTPSPGPVEALLERAEELADDGRLPEALALCAEACEAAPDLLDPLILGGDLWLEAGDATEALRWADAALDLDGEDVEAWALRGRALFDLARLDEAREVLDEVARSGLEHPGVAFVRAVLAEREGRRKEARRLYRKVERLDPGFRPLARTAPAAFERLVQEALDELPDFVLAEIENVPVQVQDFADVEDLRDGDPPLSPLIVGLFRGPARGEASFFDAVELPPAVLVYQRALELTCRSRDDLVEQLRITLLHEIGHYLGYDEDDLDDRGLG